MRLDGGTPGPGLWRYRAVLPFAPDFPALGLGEGGPPLLPLPRLAAAVGVRDLWLTEEAGNPTQSFKARGLALAASRASASGKTAIPPPPARDARAPAATHPAAPGRHGRAPV